MPDDPTTGVPDPDRAGDWLVPPWVEGATFSEVVRHFLRYQPQVMTNRAYLAAYYESYCAALENAPVEKSTYSGHARWVEDMRDCVNRCVRHYREQAVDMTDLRLTG